MANEETSADFNLSEVVEGLLGRAEEAARHRARLESDILKRRAAELAQPVTQDDAARADIYVFFLVGGGRYAIPATEIEEIIARPNLTPVPRAPAIVAGVFNRRGVLYLALDTNTLLSAPNGGGPKYALVLREGGVPAGLMVEDVSATRALPAASIRPAEFSARALRGVDADGAVVLDGAGIRAEISRALGGAPERT